MSVSKRSLSFTSANPPLLELKKVCKSFIDGNCNHIVLDELDFSLYSGQLVSIVGQSGSGKSTLLHIAGLIENFDHGEVYIDTIRCNNFSDNQVSLIRSKKIGFIYQFHHLLPEFTALENLYIARLISNTRCEHEELLEMLELFDMRSKANHYPNQLSGGEKQRVAIARAMINRPQIILADEPTGNLDDDNAQIVFDLLLKNTKNHGIATLIVTHNMEIAKKTDQIFALKHGKLHLM